MTAVFQRNVAAAMAALSLLALVSVVVDLRGPVRWVLLLLAVLLVPGSAIVSRLHLDDVSSFLALSVVTSIAVATVGGMVMVWLHAWHPLGFALVVGLAANAVLAYDAQAANRAASRDHEMRA